MLGCAEGCSSVNAFGCMRSFTTLGVLRALLSSNLEAELRLLLVSNSVCPDSLEILLTDMGVLLEDACLLNCSLPVPDVAEGGTGTTAVPATTASSLSSKLNQHLLEQLGSHFQDGLQTLLFEFLHHALTGFCRQVGRHGVALVHFPSNLQQAMQELGHLKSSTTIRINHFKQVGPVGRQVKFIHESLNLLVLDHQQKQFQ